MRLRGSLYVFESVAELYVFESVAEMGTGRANLDPGGGWHAQRASRQRTGCVGMTGQDGRLFATMMEFAGQRRMANRS